jgi:hypothetical protein
VPLQRISQLPQATELTGSEAMAVVQDGETRQAPAVGLTGPQGESIELQTTATHIQWRYPGETWNNLIALSELEGEDGEQGVDGAGLEFDWDGTQLGVRVEGETTFNYVDLQGPQGDQGEPGADGEDGAEGPAGPGLAPGGTTGQVAVKASDTDHDVEWTGEVDFEEASRDGIVLASGIRRVTVGSAPHSNPEEGDLWFDTGDHANPGAGLQITDDIDLPDGQEVVIAWNNPQWDNTGQMHNGTNQERVTCQRSGVYDIVASLRCTGSHDAHYTAWIRVDGSTYRRGHDGPGREFQLVAKTSLTQSSYIEIVIQNNTGVLQQLRAGTRTALTVTWWGAA